MGLCSDVSVTQNMLTLEKWPWDQCVILILSKLKPFTLNAANFSIDKQWKFEEFFMESDNLSGP